MKNVSVAYYFVTVLYVLGNDESIVQSGMLVYFAQMLPKRRGGRCYDIAMNFNFRI